jgi:eukaryotic-like serine/threonine-protein kinase
MEKLQTGSVLGRYELLSQLGRGGMASVWVARQRSRSTRRQRLVAVKAMLPGLARSPDFRSMFLEEGQIVRSIEHPHVVRVFEVDEDRGILYMAMEWVEGDSLRTVINEAKQRRAIPPEMAVRIIADAAAGLHAAHELRGWDGELRGIVHCDVSPHNILIGVDGMAKLVDFGVARAVAASDVDVEAEQGEQIKGKFGYMSPEQAQGKKFDRRADIFALGIVLFELTTGERLFRGRDPAHTLQLVSFGQVPQPSLLYPNYPPRLEAIVMKALEREVASRFQTADELREALEQYLVEQRILVSYAGVGQLVKRVLGTSIEHRRLEIRKALGTLAAHGDTWLSEEDVEDDVDSDRSSSSGLSPYGFTGMTGSDLVDSLPRLTLPPPAPRRAAKPWVWGLLLLATGGAGAALWAVRSSGTPAAQGNQPSATSSESNLTEAVPASSPAASSDHALTLDKLPEGKQTLSDLPVYHPESAVTKKRPKEKEMEKAPEPEPGSGAFPERIVTSSPAEASPSPQNENPAPPAPDPGSQP